MTSIQSPRRSSEAEKASTHYTASVLVPQALDEAALKLDKHGIPLSPQPSADPKDPLNWPRWLKWVVLVQICALSFTTYLSASMVVRRAVHAPCPSRHSKDAILPLLARCMARGLLTDKPSSLPPSSRCRATYNGASPTRPTRRASC